MYTIKETGKFKTWLAGLKDLRARSRIVARIVRAGQGNSATANLWAMASVKCG